MGPIDELFEHWLTQQEAAGNLKRTDEPSLLWAKYVYYNAACDMYNVMMHVIKNDHSLQSLSVVSEAMRLNINSFIEGLPNTTLN